MFVTLLSALAILPKGTVRDETAFFMLLAILAAFTGAAIYLRLRRKEDNPE